MKQNPGLLFISSFPFSFSFLHFQMKKLVRHDSGRGASASSSSSSSSASAASTLRSFAMRVFLPFMIAFWLLMIAYFKFEPRNTEDLRAMNGKSNNRKFGSLFAGNRGQETGGNSGVVASSDKRPYKHMIMVPGHAVMNLEYLDTADTQDEAWYLLPYQRNVGFPRIIAQHVHAATELALTSRHRNNSVLVFSGGQTRRDVGPTSEAASYYYLAKHNHWLNINSNVDSKYPDVPVYLEEYARDSFENLLFSMCRFREALGYYPEQITVVGFDFKEYRYKNQHREAVAFPVQNFKYIGTA
jgi:preprotein translocase subunit SecG